MAPLSALKVRTGVARSRAAATLPRIPGGGHDSCSSSVSGVGAQVRQRGGEEGRGGFANHFRRCSRGLLQARDKSPAVKFVREVVLVTSASGSAAARSRFSAPTAPSSGFHDTVSTPSMLISTAPMPCMA